ncbi:MAG: hypothetical protein FWG33_03620 [Oscillospiraceae bacterium]|nr:hypothetical protein [Oscillospiraceae bacterium]
MILKFLISAVVFLLFYIFILVSIALLSAGILAIPVSLAVITGVFTNVASDLSPVPMLFMGISCISAGLALALGIVILFPKQPYLFGRL